MKTKTGILAILSFILVLWCLPAQADILYLKNGNKMEGQVKQTSEGIWFEGMHFANDEIERVEKKRVKKAKGKKKTWFDNVMGGFGAHEPVQAQEVTKKPAAAQPGKKTDFLTRMLMGPAGKNDQHLDEAANAFQHQMNTGAMAMQQAQMLQQQANQQHQMMQMEMMRQMEGEYYEGDNDENYDSDASKREREQYMERRRKSNDSYERMQREANEYLEREQRLSTFQFTFTWIQRIGKVELKEI